jgi:hypothetical protein
MDPYEVDAVDAHALQAVLDRLPRAVRRIIVDDLVRPACREESTLLAEFAGSGLDLIENDPADLRAEDVFIALVFGELLAETQFSEAGSVEGRSVEITGPSPPSSVDRCGRLFIWNVAEHVSQRGGTKTEGTTQEGVSDLHRMLHDVTAQFHHRARRDQRVQTRIGALRLERAETLAAA